MYSTRFIIPAKYADKLTEIAARNNVVATADGSYLADDMWISLCGEAPNIAKTEHEYVGWLLSPVHDDWLDELM